MHTAQTCNPNRLVVPQFSQTCYQLRRRYCQCGGSGTICSLRMGNEHRMIEPTSKSLGSIVVTWLVSRIAAAAAAASRGRRCYHVAEPFNQSAKRNLIRGTFQFEQERPALVHFIQAIS